MGRRFIPQLHYSWKIFISFIIVFLIPATILAAYVYSKTVHSLKGQYVNTLSETTMQIKAEMDHRIANYERLAREISMNPILVSYFDDTEMTDSKVDFVYRYINPFVDWVYGLDSANFDMRFFTLNNNVFENVWIYKAAPFLNEEWYRKAAQADYNSPYWESFHPSRTFEYDRNKPLRGSEISVFLPVYSQYNNKDFTILEVFVQTDSFFGSVNDAIMLSQTDILIYNENYDIIFKKGAVTIINAEQMVKSIYTDESGNETVSIDNQPYLISIKKTDNPAFTIVGLYPLQAITGEVNKAKSSYILYLFASLCILTLLSYVFSRNLMKNIKRLVYAMRKVQQGDFDIEVEIVGNDEIAELGRDFNLMIRKIDQLIQHVYKAEILQKDAMIKALENQINPHFLYNALETIKMLAEIKRERQISDSLTDLGSLMRYAIRSDNGLIPLSAEIEHITQYCGLQNLMLNSRLELNIDIATEILGYKILKLSLQPVIENAIIHGFKNKDGQCVISVSAEERDTHISVIVRDNGNGINPERLAAIRESLCSDNDVELITSGNGIALKNVYQRLKLKFGDSGNVEINSIYTNGTVVTLRFPTIL